MNLFVNLVQLRIYDYTYSNKPKLTRNKKTIKWKTKSNKKQKQTGNESDKTVIKILHAILNILCSHKNLPVSTFSVDE